MPPTRAWAEQSIHAGASSAFLRRDIHALGEVAGLRCDRAGLRDGVLRRLGSRGRVRDLSASTSRRHSSTRRVRMQEETGLTFPLIEANAEDVPLPGCDRSTSLSPSTERASGATRTAGFRRRTAPPARRSARLPDQQPAQHLCARRGARFDVRDTSASTAWDASARLVGWRRRIPSRSWRIVRAAPRIGLRRREPLIELYAPDDAETHPYYTAVTADWARKWPSEEIWAARKTS